MKWNPCSKCDSTRRVNKTIRVAGMRLYVEVPCPKCDRTMHRRAVNKIKRKHKAKFEDD